MTCTLNLCFREKIKNSVFMQDGTPPPIAVIVCEWMTVHFPQT